MKKELIPKIELTKEDKKSLVFLAKRNEISIAAVDEEDKNTQSNEDLVASREAEIKKAMKERNKKIK